MQHSVDLAFGEQTPVEKDRAEQPMLASVHIIVDLDKHRGLQFIKGDETFVDGYGPEPMTELAGNVVVAFPSLPCIHAYLPPAFVGVPDR
jgi:hypothetical protein